MGLQLEREPGVSLGLLEERESGAPQLLHRGRHDGVRGLEERRVGPVCGRGGRGIAAAGGGRGSARQRLADEGVAGEGKHLVLAVDVPVDAAQAPAQLCGESAQREAPGSLAIEDLDEAGLVTASVVRPIKIACIEPSRILRRIGSLRADSADLVFTRIRALIGGA